MHSQGLGAKQNNLQQVRKDAGKARWSIIKAKQKLKPSLSSTTAIDDTSTAEDMSLSNKGKDGLKQLAPALNEAATVQAQLSAGSPEKQSLDKVAAEATTDFVGSVGTQLQRADAKQLKSFKDDVRNGFQDDNGEPVQLPKPHQDQILAKAMDRSLRGNDGNTKKADSEKLKVVKETRAEMNGASGIAEELGQLDRTLARVDGEVGAASNSGTEAAFDSQSRAQVISDDPFAMTVSSFKSKDAPEAKDKEMPTPSQIDPFAMSVSSFKGPAVKKSADGDSPATIPKDASVAGEDGGAQPAQIDPFAMSVSSLKGEAVEPATDGDSPATIPKDASVAGEDGGAQPAQIDPFAMSVSSLKGEAVEPATEGDRAATDSKDASVGGEDGSAQPAQIDPFAMSVSGLKGEVAKEGADESSTATSSQNGAVSGEGGSLQQAEAATGNSDGVAVPTEDSSARESDYEEGRRQLDMSASVLEEAERARAAATQGISEMGSFDTIDSIGLSSDPFKALDTALRTIKNSKKAAVEYHDKSEVTHDDTKNVVRSANTASKSIKLARQAVEDSQTITEEQRDQLNNELNNAELSFVDTHKGVIGSEKFRTSVSTMSDKDRAETESMLYEVLDNLSYDEAINSLKTAMEDFRQEQRELRARLKDDKAEAARLKEQQLEEAEQSKKTDKKLAEIVKEALQRKLKLMKKKMYEKLDEIARTTQKSEVRKKNVTWVTNHLKSYKSESKDKVQKAFEKCADAKFEGKDGLEEKGKLDKAIKDMFAEEFRMRLNTESDSHDKEGIDPLGGDQV